ncbi:hypothetical protein [Thermoleptolyngbya sp.]
MADALRDTDGWLGRDTGLPGSLPMLQAESPRSYAAAHREHQGDASHQGDRRPEDLAHQPKPEVKPEVKPGLVAGESRHLSKISPEFGARLEHLEPQQKIRAVVMLETNRPEGGGTLSHPPSAPARRQTLDERRAAIARIQQAAQCSLEEIRPILEAFHAHLLAPSPDAVGAVPVEIDAAGIPALAQSSRVRTILEDQEIRTIDGSQVRRSPPFPCSR